jgi:hypothetical protein
MAKNRDKKNVGKVVDAAEAVEKTEEEAKNANGRTTVELSTGVILNIRPVPRHFIYEVTRRFVRPKPPVVFVESKGREEENAGDPDYADALENYIGDVANAATDTALILGTAVKELPKDVPDQDSEDFLQIMDVLGITDLENPKARYLYWIKSIAAPTTEDVNNLLGEIGRLTGVSESDTEDAVRRFRSLAPRRED